MVKNFISSMTDGRRFSPIVNYSAVIFSLIFTVCLLQNSTSKAASAGSDPVAVSVKACTSAQDSLPGDCLLACPIAKFQAVTPPVKPSAQDICVQKCKAKLTSCIGAVSSASGVCLTSTSTWIQSGAAYVEAALDVANVAGVVNQCSTMGKVMNDIGMVLGAYNIACGGLEAYADSACPGSKTAPTDPLSPIYSLTKTAPTCNKAIQGYILNLATGAAGVLEGVLRLTQANSCNATDATPSTTTTYDCTQAVNANSVVCLCQATPSLAECSVLSQNGCVCQGSTTSTSGVVCTCSESSTASTGVSTSGTTVTTTATPVPVTSAAATTATTSTGAYTGLTGDPNLNSSGDTGTTSTGTTTSGLTGTTPTALEAKSAAAKGSDNSGDSSFYGGGGGGAGASGAANNSQYAGYQPGGKSDPTKKTAAQAAYEEARAQIRTAASSDNFSAVSTCINVTCPSAVNTFSSGSP